ncbi:MAG: hypothetical protein HQL72_04210 [Magnetococcales bacterium]|nr:hypothetical protein [Magnetococcales bacterium]
MITNLQELAKQKDQAVATLQTARQKLTCLQRELDAASVELDRLEEEKRQIHRAYGQDQSLSEIGEQKRRLSEVVDRIEELTEHITTRQSQVTTELGWNLSPTPFEDRAHQARLTFWRTAFKQMAGAFQERHQEELDDLLIAYESAFFHPDQHAFAVAVLSDGTKGYRMDDSVDLESRAAEIEKRLLS